MLKSMSKNMKSLFDRICMKTVLGELKWDMTEESGVFQTSILLYNVRIKGDEENPLYGYIDIYNVSGEKIIRIRPLDMGYQSHCNESSRWIEQAYCSARRQVMHVEEALDEINKALNKL